MKTLSASPTQHSVLIHAIDFTDGKLEWFPDHLKGGAREKVIDGLFNRKLIDRACSGEPWVVTDAGYEAAGRVRPQPVEPEGAGSTAEEPALVAVEVAPSPPKRRTRESSKQAAVLRMLQRPEGATIAQICAETGWQSHSVRGLFASAFKKKLGLTLVSEKTPGGDRTYHVA